ncbi:MAG: Bug family tripartite tricarboxylate transporter substrate binding protein [Advenella sp.]
MDAKRNISEKAKKNFLCIMATVMTLLSNPVLAQDWPTQPVSLVIPFSPGGSTDIIARVVGNKMSEVMGVSVVPENKGGAGGIIAANYLANAAKNGYTISLDHIGFAFNQSLIQGKRIPQKEIVPVAFIGSTPNVLVVPNSFPAKTLQEFIAFAKAHPNEINFGSGGVGSAGHLPMELLQSVTKTQMVHVPYKGSGPAITDLTSGRIQAMLMTIPAIIGAIKNNQVRAIATTGLQRPEALSDIPTFKEAGIDNFVYQPWYGIFAPKGTPQPVLDKLHTVVNKSISDPVVVAKLLEQGLATEKKTQQAFIDEVRNDTKEWGDIIGKLGLSAK